MPIAPSRLQELVALAQSAPLGELELSEHGYRIRLVAAPAGQGPLTLAAPVAGRLLAGHPLRPAPFAPPGAQVRAGEVVALVESGAVYAGVAAPCDGVLAAWLCPAGAEVAAGQALATLEAAA